MEQETKKTLLIVIWCLAAVLLIGGSVWLWIYFNQLSPYHNSKYQVTFSYPKGWEKTDDYQVPDTVVSFIRPKQTALDTFQPNINITVKEVPAQIATLTSFSETITKQMSAVFSKNIKIVEDKKCTFAKRPGHRLTMETPDTNHLKMIFVWTIKGSSAYLFTFIAEEKQYAELFPLIQRSINSFELK